MGVAVGSGGNANNAGFFLDAIEAAFRAPIEETAVRLRLAADYGPRAFLATGIAPFLKTYAFQTAGTSLQAPIDPSLLVKEMRNAARRQRERPHGPAARRDRRAGVSKLGDLPVLEPGDTRPLIALRCTGDAGTGRWKPAHEPKTALLYAPQIVVLDPLPAVAWPLNMAVGALEDDRVSRLFYDEHRQDIDRQLRPVTSGMAPVEWLIRLIEAYAHLAPAIRADLVNAVPVAAADDQLSFLTGISRDERTTLEREAGRPLSDEEIRSITQEVLLQIATVARIPGLVNPVARPGVEESVLSRYYSRLFGDSASRGGRSGVSAADPVLRRLFSLQLPGVDFARMKDIVQVRDEDVFGVMREDIEAALIAADAQDALAEAQFAAAEVFARRARRQPPSVLQALRDHLTEQSVTYGLGLAGSSWQFGWQAALPFAGTAVFKAGRDSHESKARRAQRALYAALSTTATR